MTAPSTETAIFQAIKSQVATLPMVAAYPVVWSTQTTYTPSPDQPYLRATWLPNVARRLFLGNGSPHQRLGLLQIDVMSKKTQADDIAIEVAGQVAAHFAADTKMTFGGVTARVAKAPDVATAMAGDTHIQVPVTVSVETLA